MFTKEIVGKQVQFDDEGFMTNPEAWNREIAIELAKEIGIAPLTERHWKVIEFCRSDFHVTGEAPTLRRITRESGISTKELYELFPKGPAKKVSRVAGLGKPHGCI
ncbi:MAG: TusE/DsrC/DsvC family sulfur relay protein [Chloroflexi bacterium]|nr:TusE/DsrC/DsvC family sulfur relay protein [Chloroflexota bacterium]MCI0646099.1 TusE/DsrC/DsvC family sulfur relay protein [Chloroflexota bacterium]MCI0731575.1 TusE/DsrC/DsvC family sulfur relay protein [Chloroflexota bacterium]